MTDERFVVLEERTMAGIGVEDHLGVAEFLEHCVGIVRGQHGIVAATDHKSRLADRAPFLVWRRPGSRCQFQSCHPPDAWHR